MKKRYIIPSMAVWDMAVETAILSASKGNSFDVGLSSDAMNGSEALSSQKNEDMWGNKNIWN